MRKFIYLFGILLFLFSLPVYATEDITEELRENTQENEIILDQTEPISEEIYDTNKPNYLLKDKLTHHFEKGPLDNVQVFGAYRGGIDLKWNNTYTTTYDNLNPEVGFIGTFKDKSWGFKSSYFPWQQKGEYMRSFFSDTYVVKSIPHHQVYVGYSRVNVGHEGGMSPYVLPFVNRSQLSRNFGNTRSLNAKVVGDFQYLDYNVSLGSSSHSLIGGFPGTEFNGWVDVKPFGNKTKYGKLVIGGGLNAGHFHDNYTIFSGYAGYEYKKFWTTFEAGIADGYNGSSGYSNKGASGYAYTIGYRIKPKWEVLARVDQFDPDRSISNDLKREYTAGLNYYIKGQGLKLSINYIFCQSQNLPNSQKIIVATQVLF